MRRPIPLDYSALGKLACFGGVVGPCVDALHNQALLQYDVLPVRVDLGLGVAATSALVPGLLAIAYAVIGSILPRAVARFVGLAPGPGPSVRGLSDVERAAAAVVTTALIVKLSESVSALPALPGTGALLAVALLQWRLLDGSLSTLLIAAIVSVGGPVAEIPLMWGGHWWHYLHPDYFPMQSLLSVVGRADVAVGPSAEYWTGLNLITAPCYFAVATDSIAVARYLGCAPADPRDGAA